MHKFFLLALISSLVFGTVPVVHAFDPVLDFPILVNCNDPTKVWSGEIEDSAQIDYYSIDGLVAGQVLTIDVDAEGLSSLDSFLEVFDSTGNFLDSSNDDRAPYETSVVDPYLVFTVPPDGGGTYIFGISAAGLGADAGLYNFFLECSDPSNSVEKVKVGDLLGAASGALVTISPASGASTERFASLGIDEVADIEFDPKTGMLFVAIDTGNPGRIIIIDPNNGTTEGAFTYEKGGFIALESAGETLYGVYGYESADSRSGEYYSLVTIDRETGIFDFVASFEPVETPIESLAYNSLNNSLYGVSGSNLIQIDLGSFTITPRGQMTFGNVVSLDFDLNNSLYAATRVGNQGEPGKLFEIDHATATVNREAGPLTFENASSADVTGLTFVIEEAPQDEDPTIKTICSSSFSNQTVASSESANNRLRRFKRKRNPLNSAIGLYKFEGEIGETLQLSVCLEEKEAVESEEASKSSWIEKLWPQWKPKNRVFVVIRDAIPGVDFREKKKAVLTQDEPVLDITDVPPLPATGLYYIMVIRPFRRFHNFDYCLSLESDGTAGDNLVVAWPNDEEEEK
jgi:hypothetical protein